MGTVLTPAQMADLQAVLARMDDPDANTTNTMARRADGYPCNPEDPEAQAFCFAGHYCRILFDRGEWTTLDQILPLVEAIFPLVQSAGYVGAGDMNDRLGPEKFRDYLREHLTEITILP